MIINDKHGILRYVDKERFQRMCADMSYVNSNKGKVYCFGDEITLEEAKLLINKGIVNVYEEGIYCSNFKLVKRKDSEVYCIIRNIYNSKTKNFGVLISYENEDVSKITKLYKDLTW